jgi:uncharacterized membrane protein YgcG
MEYRDFSSMPPEEERQFVSFERRTMTSAKKAWQFGYIAAAAFGVLTLIIVLSFDPPKNQHAEDLETSLSAEEDLGSKNRPEPVKKAAPAPAPDESGDEGAEGAEGSDGAEGSGAEGAESGGAESGGAESGGAESGASGAEAPAKEMPPPPKGATKAPPTAIVGDKK